MKELRIVFMGTPHFAVGILDALVKKGYNIVGVITAPDRPAGRGRKLNESAVKLYALKENITVLQPKNLKDTHFLEELKALHANLQVVVAFRMLPKVVWQMPEYGTFNLHASLLPQYRGAAPINWAIINGEEKTGVTTFFIDDKIDTGAIILQEQIPVRADEDAGELHDKLMGLGAKTVLKTVERIEAGNFDTRLQTNSPDLKLAYKIHRETCKIDWKLPLEKLYNFIRGLSPYPAAWTTLHHNDEQLLIKLFKVEKENTEHNLHLGFLIFDKKNLKVATDGGSYILRKYNYRAREKWRWEKR